MVCPHCRSGDCYRSHRRGIQDYVLTVANLKPWRCHACDNRFYAWRVAFTYSRYAHCPKCGNFELEHISRDRVDDGTLVALKRWLGVPAYRCTPCRERFFSTLPLNRIPPSALTSNAPGSSA